MSNHSSFVFCTDHCLHKKRPPDDKRRTTVKSWLEFPKSGEMPYWGSRSFTISRSSRNSWTVASSFA